MKKFNPIPLVFVCFSLVFSYVLTIKSDFVFDSFDFLVLLFWVIIPMPFVLFNLAGYFLLGEVSQSARKTGTIKTFISVVYVTRGIDIQAITRSVLRTKEVLGSFKWVTVPSVVVVSDIPVQISGVKNVVVPKSFKTKNGAKWKARALEYFRIVTNGAKKQSDVYIHLDEESILTEEVVKELDVFGQWSQDRVIGQGEIQYNAWEYGKNKIVTAVDCVRTGDDLGRFRIQYGLFRRPLFGIHGSYVVVKPRAYQDLSFDYGSKGSITEDAYFGLIASSKGYRFQWLRGFIREQSPFNIMDLLKQRRRWINGITTLIMDDVIPFKNKIILIINHISWLFGFGGAWLVLVSLFANNTPNLFVHFGAGVVLSTVLSVYMVGSFRNTENLSLSKKWILRLWNVALFPLASFIEAIATLYAIFRPVKIFEVVKK